MSHELPNASNSGAYQCPEWPHISPQYVHIWENAAFLFLNFDWDSAAHEFSSLESNTKCPYLKAILLLNIGIILSHLGDYGGAQAAFSKACKCWTKFPLTHFLLGLASYELGLYDDAQLAFVVTSRILEEADITLSLDHTPAGLDFILTVSCLRDNILNTEYARSLNRKGRTTFPLLHRLPAGLVFNNPRAQLIEVACSMQAKEWSSVHPALRNRHCATEPLGTGVPSNAKWPETEGSHAAGHLISQPFEAEGDRSEPTHNRRDRAGVQGIRTATERRRKLQVQSLEARQNLQNDSIDPRVNQVVYTAAADAEEAPRDYRVDTQQYRPRLMVARDAAPEDQSLLELSAFIRHTGPEFADGKAKITPVPLMSRLPSISKSRLEPRDARTHPGHRRDLAAFVRTTGPNDAIHHNTALPKASFVDTNTDHEVRTPTEPRAPYPYASPVSLRLPYSPSSVYSRPIDYFDPAQSDERTYRADMQSNAYDPPPSARLPYSPSSVYSRPIDYSDSVQRDERTYRADVQGNAYNATPGASYNIGSPNPSGPRMVPIPNVDPSPSRIARLASTLGSTRSATSSLFRGLSGSERRTQVHEYTLSQLEGRQPRQSERQPNRWY